MALEEYYGAIASLQMKHPAFQKVEIPPKPEILDYIIMLEATNISLVEGGLLAYPYLFLLEYTLAKTVKMRYEIPEKKTE